LRTGEVIRCYLLAHWNNFRISLSLSSAAVERLMDGLWMMAAFAVTAGFVKGIPPDLTLLVRILAALLLAGAGVFCWVVWHKHDAHSAIGQGRWSSTLRHVEEGLCLMGGLPTLAKTMLVSLLYLALQIATVWALMKADGFDLSFWVAGGVLTVVRLATVIPNAPGNLGLFQVACVVALGLFDVEKDAAKTFSFIMFFSLTLPLLVGGAIATALAHLNLGDATAPRAPRRPRATRRGCRPWLAFPGMPAWRGHSCLPCRESSRHFFLRDTLSSLRNVATNGDAAGTTARATVQPRSVSPACQVRSWRRRLLNALQDLRDIHLVVVQPRVPVRLGRIAIPAVLGARSVANLTFVRNAVSGSAGLLQEIFHQVNRIVQEVSVVRADIEVYLAL